MTRTHRIASIPGDGIGREVVRVARSALDLLAQQEDFSIDWADFDGARSSPPVRPDDAESGLDELAQTDAIFFGAVGAPDISDAVTLWGLLIPYLARVRRVRQSASQSTSTASSDPEHLAGIDLMVVRENSEGEYSELGGRFGRGTPQEFASQDAVFSRHGIERITRYAADLARERAIRN